RAIQLLDSHVLALVHTIYTNSPPSSIYTLSLHDALPISSLLHLGENQLAVRVADPGAKPDDVEGIQYAEIPHGKQNWYVQTSGLDRKSTRLNSSHLVISYAVFCLKKKYTELLKSKPE